MVCITDLSVTYLAAILERDPAHDLALLRAANFPNHRHFTPAFGKPITSNVQVLTFEYSRTTVSGGRIALSSSTRLGNVVSSPKKVEMLGDAGVDALELSFPALKGASGAPVIDCRNWDLWGLIIANVSYELLPLQIETVLDQRNNILEEVKYMLPQAVAVNIKHLETMYRRHTLKV